MNVHELTGALRRDVREYVEADDGTGTTEVQRRDIAAAMLRDLADEIWEESA